jgi:hypothetical protein
LVIDLKSTNRSAISRDLDKEADAPARSPSPVAALPVSSGRRLGAGEAENREMAFERPYGYPSLLFVHNDHEFIITAVPDGVDVVLHIADQYGRMLLPISTRVVGANVGSGGGPNRRLISARMAAMRRSIEAFDDASFLNFLETPRAASDFQWTPAEFDAASKIDWSKPAATLVHQGYYFIIGAFVVPERMVLLLRDADGPFNAPMPIPKASIMRSEAKGVDPLDFGVRIMVERIRGWTASRTAAFVRDTPRLAVDTQIHRQT